MELTSIIMPCHNNLAYTSLAVESLFRHTKLPFELILVDEASTDGSKGYFDELRRSKTNVKVVTKGQEGFTSAVNRGLEIARGDLLCVVNNDLAFTPNWLDQLVLCLKTAGEKLHIREVGLVGPASNYVGGFQAVNNMRYTLSEVDSVAEKFHELNEGNWHYTHFLSGFCLLFTRKVFEEVGFLDERFNPGGFDDNDYCLRAFRKGFALIIAGDTFIHHFGSKTLDLPPFKHMKRGMANQEKFIRKWLDDKSQKVFAMYRIKNVERWIGQSLAKTSEFADGIVILDDGSKDGTPEIVKQFPKVVDYKYHNRSLQEARDRQELLEMTKSYNPDWIVAIDGDEVWEDKVNRDYIQRLARPFDPEINAYVVRYFTFWDDIKHYRADGIFGSMSNIRMFRNLPNQFMHSDHPQGFHVNSVPRFPWGCRAVTSIRVKHYGYVNEEDRLRKFLFYTKFDTDKRRTDIGNEDYHHLVSQTVRRRKWKEDCSLSLCTIAKNEEENFFSLLKPVRPLFDEIIVVDTGSDDRTPELAELLGAKVEKIKFENFSQARNIAKKLAKGKWILQMDWDEKVENYGQILEMIEDTEIDAYLFNIANYQKDGRLTMTEMVRLFQNHPDLEYEGLIHESIEASLLRRKARISRAKVKIEHYGYLKDGKCLDKKLSFYEDLNKKELKKKPKDPRTRYSLALHYLNDGKKEEGMRLLEEASLLNTGYYPVEKELSILYLLKSKEHFEKLNSLLPSDHIHKGFTQKALEFLNQAEFQPILVGSKAENNGS